MGQNLIESIKVSTVEVNVKFGASIKVSSMVNGHFVVTKNTATPSIVVLPFKAIKISEDYNSISRMLNLYWQVELEPLTPYLITFTGLINSVGQVVEDVSIEFTTLATTTNLENDVVPVIPTPTVIDYSIVNDIYEGAIINPEQIQFKILESDPVNGDYYLPPDFSNGRMIVKFSKNPNTDYINSDYIKVQKRQIKRAPGRWQQVEAQIYLDSTRSWVYIDLPSIDHYPATATPSTEVVYGINGYEYFEKNYKYRVIFSKNIST